MPVQLPGWAAALGANGGTQHAANATIAAVILLPSALFIGATFPFVVRFVAESGADAGRASARTYAWNTVGAIFGAVGAAFLWIPFLGYRGALSFTIAINMAIAVLAAFFVAQLRKQDAALIGFVAVVVDVEVVVCIAFQASGIILLFLNIQVLVNHKFL